MNGKKIVLAGGSGFVGHILAAHFAKSGYEIVILTRAPRAENQVFWDGRTLGAWTQKLEGAIAVINLTGRSVNCRYNAENRRLILESRVFSTEVLGEAITRCVQPPAVWINAGTATIYKHSFDRTTDESGEIAADRDAKDEFSVEVAQAWEGAFARVQTPSTRKIVMRMAMVFGVEENGVFRVLRRLARLGLGGTLASGRQFVSWIHEEDFCRAVEFLVTNKNLSGAFNLTAPNPLTNREMMQTIRRVCGAPFGLPATRWMLEIGAFFMRTETELMLKSRRVVPARLMAAGFEFRHPKFEEAVREIEGRTCFARK